MAAMPHGRGARWCIRCTRISCAAATSTRRSSTRWTAAATAAASTSRRVVAIQHGEQIFHMSASFQVEEEGPDHQVPMPDVPPPEAAAGPDGRGAQAARRHAGRAPPLLVAAAPVRVPLGRADRGRRAAARRAPPVVPARSTSCPDDPILHRCLLAYVSDYHLLETATLPHGLVVPLRRGDAGQHRPRHVVPPPAARGRVAAVRAREPEQLGRRAALRFGRIFDRHGPAGRQHRAGRPDAASGAEAARDGRPGRADPRGRADAAQVHRAHALPWVPPLPGGPAATDASAREEGPRDS